MINKYACCCDHDVKVSVGLVNDLAIMYMHLHECAQICLYSVVLRITLKTDIICSRKKSFFRMAHYKIYCYFCGIYQGEI